MHQKIRIVRLSALLALGVSGAVAGCSSGEEATTHSNQVTGGPLAVGSAAAPSTGAAPSTALSTAASSATSLNAQRGQIQRLHGVIATGRTADDAAENFRQRSAATWGIDHDDVRPARLKSAAPLAGAGAGAGAANARANGVGLMHDPLTGKPKFRLYSYEQQRDGIPVFRASLRTLVR